MFAKANFSQIAIDKLMTEKSPNCVDIAYNCKRLIEEYFNSNKLDSVGIILKYWESRCGINEPIIRCKILLAISLNEFDESIYDSTIINNIIRYEKKLLNIVTSSTYRYSYNYFGNNSRYAMFDKFTEEIAGKLLKKQKENSIEYLFCKLYSGISNSIFIELQKDNNYDNTNLKNYYMNEVNKLINIAEFQWALFGGIWIPFENLEIIGNHPIIGFDIGVKHRKMTYDISMYVKFSESLNDYTFLLDDSLMSDNYFSGSYIGIELEREILRIGNNELSIVGGVAYDGFETVKVNTNDIEPTNNRGNTISSLNLSAGLSYRYHLKYEKYIGLKTRYNFIDYKNYGGTDLSGNTVIIALTFGGFTNYNKSYKLNNLHYIR